jgi:hypothetical protein
VPLGLPEDDQVLLVLCESKLMNEHQGASFNESGSDCTYILLRREAFPAMKMNVYIYLVIHSDPEL